MIANHPYGSTALAQSGTCSGMSLGQLKSITASNFDVVAMGQIYYERQGSDEPSPVISRFSASPTSVSAGQSATLSWASSNDVYNPILPSIGPVGGTSIVVTPSATTTYMLYSINQYGRTTASVSVTVR